MAETTKALAVVSEALEVIREETGKPDIQAQTVVMFLQVAMRGELSMDDLQKHVGVGQSSISRNASLLGAGRPRDPGLGLVESEEDPYNRRRKFVRLTPRGKELAKQIGSRCAKYFR